MTKTRPAHINKYIDKFEIMNTDICCWYSNRNVEHINHYLWRISSAIFVFKSRFTPAAENVTPVCHVNGLNIDSGKPVSFVGKCALKWYIRAISDFLVICRQRYNWFMGANLTFPIFLSALSGFLWMVVPHKCSLVKSNRERFHVERQSYYSI